MCYWQYYSWCKSTHTLDRYILSIHILLYMRRHLQAQSPSFFNVTMNTEKFMNGHTGSFSAFNWIHQHRMPNPYPNTCTWPVSLLHTYSGRVIHTCCRQVPPSMGSQLLPWHTWAELLEDQHLCLSPFPVLLFSSRRIRSSCRHPLSPRPPCWPAGARAYGRVRGRLLPSLSFSLSSCLAHFGITVGHELNTNKVSCK